jgi:hypothetical protein
MASGFSSYGAWIETPVRCFVILLSTGSSELHKTISRFPNLALNIRKFFENTRSYYAQNRNSHFYTTRALQFTGRRCVMLLNETGRVRITTWDMLT